MIEYTIRRIDGGGTREMERVCNDVAKEGWRLVNASAAALGQVDVVVYLFFEREPGRQEPQDAWRAQHGGRDAG